MYRTEHNTMMTEAGFADVVQLLQDEYASRFGDLRSSRSRAMDLAILKGRMRVISRHIQNLENPTTQLPHDAIATAALGGQDAIVCLLAGHGLNLDEEG